MPRPAGYSFNPVRPGHQRPAGYATPGASGGTFGLGPVQNVGSSTPAQWLGVQSGTYGNVNAGMRGPTMNRPQVSQGGMMDRRRQENLARRNAGRAGRMGAAPQASTGGVAAGYFAPQYGQMQQGPVSGAMYGQQYGQSQFTRPPAPRPQAARPLAAPQGTGSRAYQSSHGMSPWTAPQAQAYQQRAAQQQGGYGYYSPQNATARRGAFNQYHQGRRTFGDMQLSRSR